MTGYYRDLRQYLKALEDKGKIIRIKREINKDTELQPLVRLQYRGLPEEERKAFIFENVIDSKGKRYNIQVVLGALAANREIYAFGMGCDLDEVYDKWIEVQANPINPVVINDGPVHEEIHVGEGLLAHGGLEEFPHPISTPGYDAGPYITAPYWVSKDPETGIANMGTYRAQVKSPTRTGIFCSSSVKHLARHMAKRKQSGRPLEAAIVIGGPPSLGYTSVAAIPYEVSELAVCGAIAGEPLELVKCETIDLEVPAYAEIVIEGIIPTDEVEPEGPFGEALGYIGHREIKTPFFNVTCITHRKNPVYQGLFSEFPPSESSVVRGIGREGTLYRYLKSACAQPWVLGVCCHELTGSAGLIAIRLAKTEQSNVWKTLDETSKWAGIHSAQTKLVVGVDEDINIRDADAINWALSFRMQPHLDIRVDREPARSLMDPSIIAPEEAAKRDARRENVPTRSRLIMNATMKWAYPPVSLPRKEFMDRALQIWKEEKLPSLRLKEPWWGYTLGYWPADEDEDAAMAVRGDYKMVGDRLAKRRQRV